MKKHSSLLVALTLMASMIGPLPVQGQSASGVSATVELSANGVTFLPDLTGTNAVNPGQMVTVRVRYDNRDPVPGISASVNSMIPAGFTRVSGSTKNCITPSGTETVCNTDAGQAGTINEFAVWNGSTLTISPTAGLYDVSPSQTSGILEIGKKRYLNLLNCDYQNTSDFNTDDVYVFRPGNTPVTALNCQAAYPGTVWRPQNSLAQTVDLLGRAYANYQNCDYQNSSDFNTDDTVGFSPSNVPMTALGCAAPTAGVHFRPQNSLFFAGDLKGKRYVNFGDCDAVNLTDNNTDDETKIAPSMTPINNPLCNAAAPGTAIRPQNSSFDPLDLYDPTRGQGYIEFKMTAPQAPGLYTQNGILSGSNFATSQDTGLIEVRGPQSLPQCSDGIDNDGDGKVDMQDPGCSFPTDNDESNPTAAQCSDGIDNADPEDTLADYNDPGCYTNGVYNPNDNDESNVIAPPTLPQCSDGLDNDNDGRTDFFDAGCYPNNVFNPALYNPNDTDESNAAALCRWTRVNSQWVRSCQ